MITSERIWFHSAVKGETAAHGMKSAGWALNGLRSEAQCNQSKPVTKHLWNWVRAPPLIRNREGSWLCEESTCVSSCELGTNFSRWDWWRRGWGNVGCCPHAQQQQLRPRWPSARQAWTHTYRHNRHFYSTPLKAINLMHTSEHTCKCSRLEGATDVMRL